MIEVAICVCLLRILMGDLLLNIHKIQELDLTYRRFEVIGTVGS